MQSSTLESVLKMVRNPIEMKTKKAAKIAALIPYETSLDTNH